MGKKRKGAVDVSGGEKLTSNPFASLGAVSPSTQPSESPAPAATEAEPATAKSSTSITVNGVVVVRYQRKGRGGKEVTLIEKLELPSPSTDSLCRDLKRTLGCGGLVENGVIVLAGDQRKRLPELLKSKGARDVRVS